MKLWKIIVGFCHRNFQVALLSTKLSESFAEAIGNCYDLAAFLKSEFQWCYLCYVTRKKFEDHLQNFGKSKHVKLVTCDACGSRIICEIRRNFGKHETLKIYCWILPSKLSGSITVYENFRIIRRSSRKLLWFGCIFKVRISMVLPLLCNPKEIWGSSSKFWKI